MNMKVLVFDPDATLQELLKIFLTTLGHDVKAYKDPAACPVYRNLLDETCCCQRETPCADVVMIDMRMPTINAIDFLKLQRERGCKALDQNKAVMSTTVPTVLEWAMAEFGCHHIVKPFRLAEIKGWIESCEERVAVGRAE